MRHRNLESRSLRKLEKRVERLDELKKSNELKRSAELFWEMQETKNILEELHEMVGDVDELEKKQAEDKLEKAEKEKELEAKRNEIESFIETLENEIEKQEKQAKREKQAEQAKEQKELVTKKTVEHQAPVDQKKHHHRAIDLDAFREIDEFSLKSLKNSNNQQNDREATEESWRDSLDKLFDFDQPSNEQDPRRKLLQSVRKMRRLLQQKASDAYQASLDSSRTQPLSRLDYLNEDRHMSRYMQLSNAFEMEKMLEQSISGKKTISDEIILSKWNYIVQYDKEITAQEDQIAAEEARQAEEAKRAEEARRAEKAKRAEEAKRVQQEKHHPKSDQEYEVMFQQLVTERDKIAELQKIGQKAVNKYIKENYGVTSQDWRDFQKYVQARTERIQQEEQAELAKQIKQNYREPTQLEKLNGDLQFCLSLQEQYSQKLKGMWQWGTDFNQYQTQLSSLKKKIISLHKQIEAEEKNASTSPKQPEPTSLERLSLDWQVCQSLQQQYAQEKSTLSPDYVWVDSCKLNTYKDLEAALSEKVVTLQQQFKAEKQAEKEQPKQKTEQESKPTRQVEQVQPQPEPKQPEQTKQTPEIQQPEQVQEVKQGEPVEQSNQNGDAISLPKVIEDQGLKDDYGETLQSVEKEQAEEIQETPTVETKSEQQSSSKRRSYDELTRLEQLISAKQFAEEMRQLTARQLEMKLQGFFDYSNIHNPINTYSVAEFQKFLARHDQEIASLQQEIDAEMQAQKEVKQTEETQQVEQNIQEPEETQQIQELELAESNKNVQNTSAMEDEQVLEKKYNEIVATAQKRPGGLYTDEEIAFISSYMSRQQNKSTSIPQTQRLSENNNELQRVNVVQQQKEQGREM